MPTVESGPGPLYYETFDMTPPWLEHPETILFHHGVGIDRRIWSEWLPPLAHDHRLVWMDFRGFGKSHIPEAGFGWTIEGLAADVLAVADAAGAERFHYVGESLGGALGLYLAVHHRDRLHSIAPCTSPYRGAGVDWLSEWRSFMEANGMAAWSARMMERRFPPSVPTDAKWHWFDSVQAACAPESIIGTGEMLMGLDLTDDLAKIATPTILISADSSPFLGLHTSATIYEKVPDAQLSVIAGARHGVVFSHARACVNAYRAFLERLKASPSV